MDKSDNELICFSATSNCEKNMSRKVAKECYYRLSNCLLLITWLDELITPKDSIISSSGQFLQTQGCGFLY